jgi:HlyD family secretion protein
MKRLLAIILPLIVLGALITWRLGLKRTEAAAMAKQRTARASAVPQVAVAPVARRDLQSVFEATGTLEAPLNVKISSKISGRIEYLRVHEGDRVSRGQVLVRLDGSQVEADVRRAEAAVAEANYKLAQAQLNQGPTTVSVATQIKQQTAAVASARTDLNQVDKNLASQIASAEADVADLEARIGSADATIANAKANIAKVQATLNNANTRLERITGLYKQGFTAAQDVDDAKAEVAVQQANLDAAQGQLQAAQAARESVVAQKRAAEQQVKIVRTKGEADIEAARQKVRQVEAALELARANTAQNPAYKQGLQALRASIAAAKASLASARAQRAETVLTCPLDGYVTSRLADPGTMATPGQPLLAVQFFKQVWVSVAVPDAVSARMRTGQSVNVTFDAIPGRTFTATVVQINPSADTEARQFTVRAALDNADGSFRPGMFAHVAIVTEQVIGALAVPREAIQEDAEGSFVHVVDGESKVHRRAVMTGLADATYVSITEGLQAGEAVVTLCAVPLKEGQTVKTGEGGGRGEDRDGSKGGDARGGRGGERGGPPGQAGAMPAGAPAAR